MYDPARVEPVLVRLALIPPVREIEVHEENTTGSFSFFCDRAARPVDHRHTRKFPREFAPPQLASILGLLTRFRRGRFFAVESLRHLENAVAECCSAVDVVIPPLNMIPGF